MSTYTSFPDAIVFPDGTIRLVTRAAKYLAYANTNIAKIFSLSTANAVPDYLMFDDATPQMFEDEGFTVRWERQPVGHYRSKRRRWPKSTDAKVIDFLQRIPEQTRKDAMFRAYGRHRQRHHRMQEAKKRADADKE